MFDELSKSIKSVLYERVTSPLLGCVAFFWISFNWKALAYFFLSDASVENRITHISENYSDIYCNVINPLALGVLVSLVYPLVAFLPFWISEKIQHIQRNIKQSLSMSQLLTLDQSLSLRQELVAKEKKIKSIIEDSQTLRLDLAQQIKTLTSENTDLYYRLSELDIVDPEADPREVILSSMERKVLSCHTGMKEGYVQVPSDLASHLEDTVEEISLALQSLHRRGFLHEEDVEDEPGYSLTKLGRKYLGYQKAQLADKLPNKQNKTVE